MRVRVEVCVETPQGAIAAQQAGADRVELCQALIVGGLTPSLGCVVAAAGAVSTLGVHVLIRPREGDFVFTALEVDTMLADIAAVRRETAQARVEIGFVVGALTTACVVDAAVVAELVAAADGAPVSFHRAFDLTPDLDRSLDTLIELGVARVLTGGGAPKAVDGTAALARLVQRAGHHIDVMPGGSIRAHNVGRVLAETGASDVHFRAATSRPNLCSPYRPDVRMSSGRAPDETVREETSGALVREMVALVGAASVTVDSGR